MNNRLLLRLLGSILLLEAAAMAPALLLALLYGEGDAAAFLVSIGLLLACGLPLRLLSHPGEQNLRAREGFLSVALSWVLLSAFGDISYTIIYMGIGCFGLSLVFQLITLPVEFNASHRAMTAIAQTGLLTEDEQKGARKTLQAAALTYVAATATALAQLLRLLILFGNRNNRDRR